MGTGNIIGPYCIIGDVPESIKYFDQLDYGVKIGNNNRFTKQVTIDAGTESPTTIHNDTLLLKNAHVGHDSILYDHSELRCNAILGGHCRLGKGSKIMLGAIIHPRTVIPEDVIVGMGAVVIKNTHLVSGGTYIGIPAYQMLR